ncbi:MAG: DinB family protein [Chloroflexi bacterium]|nr:DinB family protein [Chloroflexota bacterium]
MSSQSQVESLLRQCDDVWSRVQEYLAGIRADEFAWSPINNVWHLIEQNGRWTIPYAWVPPQPAPFTTIAWRMAHMAANKVLVLDHAFGKRQARLANLNLPADAEGMMNYLRDCHLPLRAQIEQLNDADLATPRYTEWGEQRPTERIIVSAILHDMEHGAQIATVREFYRHWTKVLGAA